MTGLGSIWEEREKQIKIQTLPRATFSVSREEKEVKAVEVCTKRHRPGEKLLGSISGAMERKDN